MRNCTMRANKLHGTFYNQENKKAQLRLMRQLATSALSILLRCLSLADLDRNIVAVLGCADGSPSASVHYTQPTDNTCKLTVMQSQAKIVCKLSTE